jgi:drug/metabolite transporter (DMT)-like permease
MPGVRHPEIDPTVRTNEARRKGIGYSLVAIAAVGWGTWPLILRHAPMPAALSGALVMTVMTIASAPLMLRDRLSVKASPRQWLEIVWLGIADSGNVLLFFAAYQRTTVAIAVLTHYLTPIFVALGAPFLVHEKLGARTKAAVAVSFVGLFLLLAPWRTGFGAAHVVGAALGAGSAVFYASNVLTNKRLTHVFSGSEMMFFHGLVGMPLLWALVPAGAWANTPKMSILIVLAAALGIGTFCGLSFTWGLKRVHASHASVLTLLEPFVAVVLAAVVLGQGLGIVSMVGGVFILGGAVAVVVQSDPT